MMSTLQIFLQKQFLTTYNQTEWFVSLNDALKNLTAEQSTQKPAKDLPSIFEIVTHLIYWNERHIKNITSQPFDTTLTDNEQSFIKTTIRDWEELHKKADVVFAEWQKELGGDKFSNPKWAEIAGHIITHNAYHIGQIVLIRKLQNSWNATDGVK